MKKPDVLGSKPYASIIGRPSNIIVLNGNFTVTQLAISSHPEEQEDIRCR